MSIEVKNISFSYNENGKKVKIFENVSLSIQTGKITSRIGKSGSGKSTLLKLIAGLLTPSRGSISIDNNSEFCAVTIRGRGFTGVVWDDVYRVQ